MIGDIPSMEKGIPLIMDVILLMVDGTIFILIEGRTSVTEQLGDMHHEGMEGGNFPPYFPPGIFHI
jgi:hypothetical protein